MNVTNIYKMKEQIPNKRSPQQEKLHLLEKKHFEENNLIFKVTKKRWAAFVLV